MVTKASGASRAAAAGEAMAVVDARGLVAGWSEGARRLTGYGAGDVTGRPAADLVDGDAAVMWRALLTHGDAVVDLRYRDGRRQKVALRICPLRGGEGERRKFVVTATPDQDERGLGELAFNQASMSMSVFDTGQRYLRMNDWACQVMGQPEEEFRHQYFSDTVEDAEHSQGFLRHLEIVVETGQPVRYESWTRSPSGRRMHAWTSEMWPLRDHSGELIGTALAAFDSSEQFWARQRLALLNEAADSIGTTLDVLQTARELAELVVPRLADFASVDLLESVLQGEEPETVPADGAVELRRAAHHSRTPGVPEAAIGLGSADVYPPTSPPALALLTGEPVLTRTGDTSLDSWFAGHGARSAKLQEAENIDLSLMAVPLVARGTTLGVAVFVRVLTPEHPDAFDQDDMSLAEELSSRAAVCVDNARRYTKERTTALALQRSLLPKTVAGQAAVEFASRYLPALSQAGVGGDWFDVIPLSGTRVALVVGDVVGHGIHASVTMGRLRTAVWALADVDLPPDELLTHLDDLVEHLAAGDGTGDGEIGATCLYAVYDPVDRSCSIASAGHLPPVVVLPDGTCGGRRGGGGTDARRRRAAVRGEGAGAARGLGPRPLHRRSGRGPRPRRRHGHRRPVRRAAGVGGQSGERLRRRAEGAAARRHRPTTWPCCSPAPAPSTRNRWPSGTSPTTRRWSPTRASWPPTSSPAGAWRRPPSSPNSSSANSSPTPSATAAPPSSCV